MEFVKNLHRSAIILKPLTGKVSNTSHLDLMQCSARKICILGPLWISLWHLLHTNHPHTHTVWQHYLSSFLQRDSTVPCKNSLGWAKKHVKEVFPWPLNSPDTYLMRSESISTWRPIHKDPPHHPQGPKDPLLRSWYNTPGHFQIFWTEYKNEQRKSY